MARSIPHSTLDFAWLPSLRARVEIRERFERYTRVLVTEPGAMRKMPALRWLSIASIGGSLACATCFAFSGMGFGGGHREILVCTLSTFFFGTIWARLLLPPPHSQRRNTRGKPLSLRARWLLSAPLAALNAAVACACCMGNNDSVMSGFFLGLTLGGLIWVPALALTLFVFGLPLARAQRLAAGGMAGEERGYLFVGATTAIIAALSLTAASRLDTVTLAFDVAFAALGIAGGAATSLSAKLRARARRAFVDDVLEGRRPGFRINESPAGPVLVRVTSVGGTAYRVTDFEEEIARMNDAHDVVMLPEEGREREL